jgi:hypothetical protein
MNHDEHGDSLGLTEQQLDSLLRAADDDLLDYVRATSNPAAGLAALMTRAEEPLGSDGSDLLTRRVVAVIALRGDARAIARAIDDARDRDRERGMEFTRALEFDRERALSQGHTDNQALIRAFARIRSLAGTLAQGIDLALDINHNLAQARVSNIAQSLLQSLGTGRARGRDPERRRGSGPVFTLELARGHIWQLIDVLDTVPVDASAADLSHLEITDFAVLWGVVWTKKTVWPPQIQERVGLLSEEIGLGVWRVRGGTEREYAHRPTV